MTTEPVPTVGPDPKAPWERSGFWPTVGAVLLLIGNGIKAGTGWLEVLAECLLVLGAFLVAAKASPSVSVKRLDGYEVTPHTDWRKTVKERRS